MNPCYAYLQKKRFGNVTSYEDWCAPALVKNTLELLDRELPKFKNKIKILHYKHLFRFGVLCRLR